jgi:hypothetical protein
MLTPATPWSGPGASGGFDEAEFAWWGLWQSAQVTWRGIAPGSSVGSWDQSLAAIGWALILASSRLMFKEATLPS